MRGVRISRAVKVDTKLYRLEDDTQRVYARELLLALSFLSWIHPRGLVQCLDKAALHPLLALRDPQASAQYLNAIAAPRRPSEESLPNPLIGQCEYAFSVAGERVIAPFECNLEVAGMMYMTFSSYGQIVAYTYMRRPPLAPKLSKSGWW